MRKARVQSLARQSRLLLLVARRPAASAALVTGLILTAMLVVVANTAKNIVAISVSSLIIPGGVVILIIILIGLLTFGLHRTAELIVILGVGLTPLNRVHTSGAASFVTAADAAFLVGFGLMLPGLLQRRLHVQPAFLIAAVGVFVVGLLASLLSVAPLLSINLVVRLLVGAYGLTLLIAWWSPERWKVVTMAWAYVAGNVVSVGYGFVKGEAAISGRRIGLTEHPNIYGLCALLGLALVPFLMSQTPARLQWLPVAGGGVCFIGIWTSGSRGALAAAIAVAVIYPVLRRSVMAGLGLVSAFAVFLIYSNRLLNETSGGNALGRLLGANSAGSDQAREELFDKAREQFLTHPLLGVGFAHALAAHIIYLQVAAGLGIIGLAFYLVALGSTTTPVLSVAPPYNLLALPALSYVLLGFVTSVLWDRYIWAVLALGMLAPRLARAEQESSVDTEEGGSDETARVDAAHRHPYAQ